MSDNFKRSKSLIGALVAGMIAMTAFIPATALAVTSYGYSDVTLVYEDPQLSVSAAPAMPIVLKSSGNFLVPDKSSFVIENDSMMPISVKSLKTVNVLDGTELARYLDVSSIDNSKIADKRNVWGMDISANNDHVDLYDSKDVDLRLSSAWNVSANSSLGLNAVGQIKQIDGSIDFSEPKRLCSVIWTFSTELNE